MTAFASTLRQIAAPVAAIAGALALLAACGQQQTTAADGFKPVPVTPVLGDVPLGSDTAPVTVIEYASFACGHCRDFWKQEFPRLKADYIDTGKVKYIFRDFPIDPDLSVLLASVSRCKGAEKYYELVDDIFSEQHNILEAAPKGAAGPIVAQIAERNGMTREEARTCIDHAPAIKEAIQKSAEEGSARGVRATPTVFVNDEQVMESGYEPLKAVIEKKLNPGADAATPAAPATAAPPASAPGQ